MSSAFATRAANSVMFACATRFGEGRHRGSFMAPVAAWSAEKRAHRFGQRSRSLRRAVDPDDLRGTFGVFAAVDPQFVLCVEARTSHGSDEHAHFDRPGVFERLDEGAARVDDDRARSAARSNLFGHAQQPFDAGLFHVAEVDRVVDVALGVHVSPANRDRGRLNGYAGHGHRRGLRRKANYNRRWVRTRQTPGGERPSRASPWNTMWSSFQVPPPHGPPPRVNVDPRFMRHSGFWTVIRRPRIRGRC